jgi:hypothetical protein
MNGMLSGSKRSSLMSPSMASRYPANYFSLRLRNRRAPSAILMARSLSTMISSIAFEAVIEAILAFLRELFEHLGDLVQEELLSSAAGVNSREDRSQLPWLTGKGSVKVNKAPHRADGPVVVLSRTQISTITA